MNISRFQCPDCENVIPIPRVKTRVRENGHIKDLFCPWCNKVQKTVEYKNNQAIRTLAGDKIDHSKEKRTNGLAKYMLKLKLGEI